VAASKSGDVVKKWYEFSERNGPISKSFAVIASKGCQGAPPANSSTANCPRGAHHVRPHPNQMIIFQLAIDSDTGIRV
jgi:hypothetical protein